MGEMINAYRILLGQPKRKRPLVGSTRRWEDDIEVYFCEIEFWGVDWIHMAQNRDRRMALVNTVVNLRVP
jgi:hypothetical protein